MPEKHYLLMSGILFGIGIATVLYRQSLIGIFMGILVASSGIMVSIATLAPQRSDFTDGVLFAIVFAGAQLTVLLVGHGILFRRHRVTGGTESDRFSRVSSDER